MRASTFPRRGRPLLPRLVPLFLTGSLLAPALTGVGVVHAAPSKAARNQASLEEVAVMLSSSDEDEVRTALETAATLPARDVVDMLDERVRAGLSRVLLDVAIDSLLLLDDKSAQPLLLELARHRRPEVRVRALEVLGRQKPAQSESTLAHALTDQSADVRQAAANALAESGARASTAALGKALVLGVEAAGRALGRVAKPDEVAALLGYVDRLPIATVTPLLEALLARRDVSENDKLLLIQKVSALPGDDAATGVEALFASLPSDASPRVRRALTEAVAKGKSE